MNKLCGKVYSKFCSVNVTTWFAAGAPYALAGIVGHLINKSPAVLPLLNSTMVF
jgi:hypothetical protein